MKIVVIGAGASGIVASLYASKKGKVILIEKNNVVGKKILVTGNGKCNYFNDDFKSTHYNSSPFISKLITSSNKKVLTDFFNSIGIVGKVNNGYYYPMSEQAVSIQNIFKKELINNKVDIKLNTEVKDIIKEKDGFTVVTNNGVIKADKVIFSAGSKALYDTKVEDNNYKLLKKLGHTIIEVKPGLSKLYTDISFSDVSGVRVNASLALFDKNKYIKKEEGELLLTGKGLSGICTMQLSNYANRLSNPIILINFLDKLGINNPIKFEEYFNKRNESLKGRTISEIFDTILNYKLSNFLIKKSNISLDKKYNDLSKDELDKLINNFINFKVKIVGYSDFKESQICLGGVSLDEVNPDTMESRKVKDLYITGEILDVNGDCGGYNLAFAFLSGIIAGIAAGDKND